MSRLITGICGEICAGKGMVERHLKKRYDGRWDYTRFSTPLSRALEALGFGPPPHTREDLQDLSTLVRGGFAGIPQDGAVAAWLRQGIRGDAFRAELRRVLDDVFGIPEALASQDIGAVLFGAGLGEDTLARAIDRDCMRSAKDCMIVDGVRRDADIETLMRRPNFHSIYITAPLRDRFEWAKARNEKAGDDALTWERFQRQDQAETERQIAAVGAKAHLILRNGKHRSPDDVLAELDAYLDRVDADA